MRHQQDTRVRQHLSDLEAFCATCPESEEVTHLLQGLGFDLVFQMERVPGKVYNHMPALPAQYHYSDRHGTEVIYLAGRDARTDDEPRLPAHESRFWLFSGSDPDAYQRVAGLLAMTWRLTWLRAEATSTHHTHTQVA